MTPEMALAASMLAERGPAPEQTRPLPRRRPGQAGSLSVLIVTLGLACGLAGAALYSSLRKDLTLVVAGQVIHKLTFQRTVAQALGEAGISLDRGDEVAPAASSLLRDGQTVVVRRAVPVTIAVDGKRLQVKTAAETVADTLRKVGVALGPSDKVFPPVQASPTAHAEIRVVRILHRTVTEQITIPYILKAAADPALPRGVVRVRQQGRRGLRERQFKVTVADGAVVSREFVAERMVTAPVDRVIDIGSQILVASRGEFIGREYMDMVATAYSPYCCQGVAERTAMGLTAGYGVVAVDPTVIPLGTTLYIEGYGQAIAGDTGSAIKGLRIDLGFATKREAIRFGRRTIRVYILSRKTRS